jgi:hypothetical protein
MMTRMFQRPASVLCLVLVACGSDGGAGAGPDAGLGSRIEATPVVVLPPDFRAASLAALDAGRVAVARVHVEGEVECPDCVDLEPEDCPVECRRARVTVSVLDVATGVLAEPLLVAQVFPATTDHDVNQVEIVALDSGRVGVAWLDCDNRTCMGLYASMSCTARYTVVDLTTGVVGPVATLYEQRFGYLQLVAHPARAEVLAVTGMTYGAFGAGVRAAIFDETGGQALLPWTALGGVDALSPAAVATPEGFVVVADDRRPQDAPPEAPCASSCECAGNVQIDPERGGLYAHELSLEAGVHGDLVILGLTQDGHLEGGHFHARQVLAVAARGDELVIAAGQAIDEDAELFVGRGASWSAPVAFDSPIPLWIGILAHGERAAWLGSQPEPGGAATINRLVAGAWDGHEQTTGPLAEPLDSHVFEAAQVVTPDGVRTTFLLRGLFGREGETIVWEGFDVVRVSADW